MGREGRSEKVTSEQDLKEGAVSHGDVCRKSILGREQPVGLEHAWRVRRVGQWWPVVLRLLFPSIHSGWCSEEAAPSACLTRLFTLNPL